MIDAIGDPALHILRFLDIDSLIRCVVVTLLLKREAQLLAKDDDKDSGSPKTGKDDCFDGKFWDEAISDFIPCPF